MTPKEKAKELVEIYVDVNEFYNIQNNKVVVINYNFGKQCALIAVDEILNVKSFLKSMPLQDVKYWQDVKQEIELL